MFAFKFQQHFSVLLFLLEEKILWHLRQNHRIILTYSYTFWITLTWAPVLLQIPFSPFSPFSSSFSSSSSNCNNKPLHCRHGPETLWTSVKHLWALVRTRPRSWLGEQPSHAAKTKLMTRSQEEKPFLRETTCIALPSKAQDAKRCPHIFSEDCRRRSPGEEGDVWISVPDRLYWSYTEMILLLYKMNNVQMHLIQ